MLYRQFDKLTNDEYVFDIEADSFTGVYTNNHEPIFVNDIVKIQSTDPTHELCCTGKVQLIEGYFCIDTGNDLINLWQECAIITKETL